MTAMIAIYEQRITSVSIIVCVSWEAYVCMIHTQGRVDN